LPEKHFASINHITGLCILNHVLLATYSTFTYLMKYSLYTVSSFALRRSVAQITPGLRSLPLLHAFYKSVYLELIVVLYHNNRVGFIHALLKPHVYACVSSK